MNTGIPMEEKPHLKGHTSLAEMIKGHIENWRKALNYQMLTEGENADFTYFVHELMALNDIELAVKKELLNRSTK